MVRVLILAVFGAFLILPFVAAVPHAAEAPTAKATPKADQPKPDPAPGPPLVAANPGAGSTVVALIDYEDPGAQLLREKLSAFGKSNRDIKLEIKPWAVSGPLARLSAKAAYAAGRQGKFAAFHEAMLGDSGSHTYLSLRDLSAALGLDWDKLAKDLDDPKVSEAVDANGKFAEGLKITSGPAFVASGRVFNDPWNKLDFAAIAAAARSAKGSAAR